MHQEDATDSHADERREPQAAMHSQEWNGHKTSHPGAHNSTKRVASISVANTAANYLGCVRHNFTDQRKNPAHTQSRWQNHHKCFDKGEPDCCSPVGIAKTVPPGVEPIEQASQDGNGQHPIDANAHL